MAKRSQSKANGANVSRHHVSAPVLEAISEIAQGKDMVTVGPVQILLTAGQETVLSWPSTTEVKDQPRKARQVDWFREEINRSTWAKDLEEHIKELQGKPKNVVNDREIQTLRQRISQAAKVLRQTRDLASKIVDVEGHGFTVTLPTVQSLTRTVFPITVIDDKKKGLPVQLSIRDFLNLQPVKGAVATDLEIKGARSGGGTPAPFDAQDLLASIKESPSIVPDVFHILTTWIDTTDQLPTGRRIRSEAKKLDTALDKIAA